MPLRFWVTRKAGRFIVNHVPGPLPPPNFPSVPPPLPAHLTIRLGGMDRVIRGQAAIKAWTTLLRFLTPSQQADLALGGLVRVEGSHGGKYKIDMRHGYTGNVYGCNSLWETGKNYCAHLPAIHNPLGYDEDYPTPDHFLAQMMTIRFQEGKFLKKAY